MTFITKLLVGVKDIGLSVSEGRCPVPGVVAIVGGGGGAVAAGVVVAGGATVYGVVPGLDGGVSLVCFPTTCMDCSPASAMHGKTEAVFMGTCERFTNDRLLILTARGFEPAASLVRSLVDPECFFITMEFVCSRCPRSCARSFVVRLPWSRMVYRLCTFSVALLPRVAGVCTVWICLTALVWMSWTSSS